MTTRGRAQFPVSYPVLKVYPGHGHWPLGESEGETIVRDIHRWLVQKLGDEILLAEFPEQE